MNARLVMLVAAAAAAGSVAIAPAVQSQTAATKTVGVTLKEFTLKPSVASVSAGKITFVVKNAGKMTHELVVVRTNKPAGALPVKGGKAVVKDVGEVEDIDAGATKRLTVTLKPGKYVLLCNVVGHYKAGQYASFTVR